jgi:hypothetical protein
VVVQAFSHAHFLEVRDDSWDVVYAFVGYGDLWAHPTSLTQFSFSRENSRELSALSSWFWLVQRDLLMCPACKSKKMMMDAAVAPKVGCINPFGITVCNVYHLNATAEP